jgi:alcohol dehydrogenase class IV
LRDESAGVDELLKWLVDLNEDFGMPTDLHSLGIAETAVPDMVEECIVSNPRPNNPRPFDRDALSELYRCLHAGALDKYAAGTALSAGREPR